MSDASPAGPPVLQRVDGLTGYLTINRPRVRNALDNDALVAISSALDAFESQGCRALVISGSDNTFCAGSDVKALRANNAAYQEWHTRKGQEIFSRLEAAPFLTVAVVTGFCLGGGVELTLACDVRISASDSEWGFPEVTLGAIPSWGGTQRLPEFVGLGRAKRMLLTGERMRADQLATSGLIDYVEPTAESAFERAMSLAARAEDTPERAFNLIKRLALASQQVPSQVGLWMESLSDDAVAGTIAELPKKPVA